MNNGDLVLNRALSNRAPFYFGIEHREIQLAVDSGQRAASDLTFNISHFSLDIENLDFKSRQP